MKFIYKLVRFAKRIFHESSYFDSSDKYIDHLRTIGVKVGNGSCIFDTHHVDIDETRPELLEIGDNVFIHRGTTIMTHDWASWCFVNSHNEFYPAHRKIIIGNNVWMGMNVTILGGAIIGDNVIIGAGSIVTKPIPSNSVAIGSPAKVVSSYEEYMKKRKKEYVDEAIEYANAIIDSGRKPVEEDFYDDYPCFVDGHNYKDYKYPYSRVFNPSQFESWKSTHKAVFNGFDDFMKKVYSLRKNER